MPPGELTGRQLGEFVVKDKLGEGAFGEVYRAEQRGLDREAVIKALQAQHLASPDVTDRFLREARLASRLDHPYAAHVYAFGAEADGLLWIAMELVRGTPLDQILVERGPLPLDRLAPLFDRLCQVVHTAHEQGIVHRDLKPANVMVIARAGRMLPKLLDLGVAKLTTAAETPAAMIADERVDGALTRLGDIVGSPRYMAPEQWIGSASVDARTDVYALGVLAYQALTGRPPFDGKTLGEIARAHAQTPPPPVGDGFPAGLDAVFRRALAKAQDQRYPTTLELGAAFRDAAGIAAEPEPLPHLPEPLRDRWLGAGPQPLAEAVAALDGARNPHQAQAAIERLVIALCRWLAVLALAARRGREVEERERQAVRALHRHKAAPDEWIEVARALTRGDAVRPELHPIPELVRALHDHDGALFTRVLREPSEPTGEEAALRARLTRQLGTIAELLERFDFLTAYVIVVGETSWMGLRRTERHVAARPGAIRETHRPYLLDGESRPLLALWPLVQCLPATPGGPDELFVLDGGGRRGARLLAAPRGFELEDERVWGWLGEQLAPATVKGEEPHPYRGLSAFSTGDAARFFGREREQAQILNRLRVTPFLALVGASGAGKSSLLAAGILPHLPEGWTASRLRPGSTPRAALAAAPPADVLVVDQLEELFTLCTDPAERLGFAAALPAAARRVVVTLRDDFLARAAELPALRELLPGGVVLVTTPGEDDLLRILTLPAERAGYRFDDPELPREMVAAVAGKPGALALLSFTAARLWDERDRSFQLLTRRAYEALGGVAGALARHAEDVRAAMTAPEQALLREAFRHLVTAEGTRAFLAESELLELLGADPAAQAVIGKLIAARLVVIDEGRRIEVIHEALLDAWPRLVEWRREDVDGARLRDQLRTAARQWDERGRPGGLLWRGEALAELERWRLRTPGALTSTEEAFTAASQADAVRGRRIRRGLTAAVIAGLTVALAVTFSLARRATEAQAVAETNAARANAGEARAERGLIAQYQEQGRSYVVTDDAVRAFPYLAEAYRRGGENPTLLFLLGRAGRMLERQRFLLQHEGRVFDATFDASGEHVLTVSGDETAGIWDASSGRRRHRLRHRAPVLGLALHPDGATFFTASDDGTAIRWSIATGTPLMVYAGTLAPIRLVEVDTSGTRLLTGGPGNGALWDVATGRRIARLAIEPDRSLRRGGFLADGRVVTAGIGEALRVWSARGEALAALGDDGHTMSITVDAAGRTVLQALDGGDVIVWDGSNGPLRQRQVLRGHRGASYAPAITAAGDAIVTTGADLTLRLHRAAGTQVLRGHGGAVFFAMFDARGERLASTGSEGVVRIWDGRTGDPVAALVGHTDQVSRVRFSRDGASVISAGFDGTARLWSVADPEVLATAPTHAGDVTSLALVGDSVVTSGSDGRIVTSSLPALALTRAVTLGSPVRGMVHLDDAFFAVTDAGVQRVRGTEVTPLGDVRSARAVRLDGVRFAALESEGIAIRDRAGTRLALWPSAGLVSLDEDQRGGLLGHDVRGRIVAFDAEGHLERSWDHGAGVVSLSSQAGGTQVLSAGMDRLVRLWDRATGTPLRTFEGHTDVVTAATMTTDRTLVATASTDGSVRLWDAETGDTLAIYRLGGARPLYLAVSASGERLVVADDGGRLTVLAIGPFVPGPGRLESVACRVPLELEHGRLVPRTAPCR